MKEVRGTPEERVHVWKVMGASGTSQARTATTVHKTTKSIRCLAGMWPYTTYMYRQSQDYINMKNTLGRPAPRACAHDHLQQLQWEVLAHQRLCTTHSIPSYIEIHDNVNVVCPYFNPGVNAIVDVRQPFYMTERNPAATIGSVCIAIFVVEFSLLGDEAANRHGGIEGYSTETDENWLDSINKIFNLGQC